MTLERFTLPFNLELSCLPLSLLWVGVTCLSGASGGIFVAAVCICDLCADLFCQASRVLLTCNI